MKTKIIILLTLLVSVGIAQQKKVTGKEKAGKELIELQKYPAPLTPISPEYPNVAKLAGIQGKVYVETLIDENGNVVDTKILKSEQESLNAAAMEAIKKTKFSPGVNKENKNVKAKVVIPINFKLDEKVKVPDLGVPIDAPGDISDPDIDAFIKVEKVPEMLESAKPEYPEEAKANKITGKVYVKVLITKEGNPKKAVVIRSDSEILNQPAVDAAMKSKFSPALQGGKPIAVWIVLPFRFALEGKEPNQNLKEHSTLEEAKKDYASLIYFSNNPAEAKKIGNIGDYKTEKVDTDIRFGDESAIYKILTEKGDRYGFFARKDKVTFKYFGKSLEEIRGYVDGLRSKEK